MQENKRRFSRVPFNVPLTFKVDGAEYKIPRFYNLSVGGCLLPISHEIASGIPCEVIIKLGGEESGLEVDVEGEIIRATGKEIAVKFTRIDPESLYHLQNIIRYNSPDADVIEQEINEHPGLS